MLMKATGANMVWKTCDKHSTCIAISSKFDCWNIHVICKHLTLCNRFSWKNTMSGWLWIQLSVYMSDTLCQSQERKRLHYVQEISIRIPQLKSISSMFYCQLPHWIFHECPRQKFQIAIIPKQTFLNFCISRHVCTLLKRHMKINRRSIYLLTQLPLWKII